MPGTTAMASSAALRAIALLIPDVTPARLLAQEQGHPAPESPELPDDVADWARSWAGQNTP